MIPNCPDLGYKNLISKRQGLISNQNHWRAKHHLNLLLLHRDRLHLLLTQLVLLNLFILHELVAVLASVPPHSYLTTLTVI